MAHESSYSCLLHRDRPAGSRRSCGGCGTRGDRTAVHRGRHGRRFKLISGNWHGGSGTWDGSGDPNDPAHNHAGEVANQMPLGLDRAPIAAILASFHELGINSIRLQFSNEMIHDDRPVPDTAVAANPELRGKTPLQVYDMVVQALTTEGFAVILNNHTTTSRWCCGLDGNERWNTSQSV